VGEGENPWPARVEGMSQLEPKKRSLLSPDQNKESADFELNEALKALRLAHWRWNRSRRVTKAIKEVKHPDSCRCDGTNWLYAPGRTKSLRCTGPRPPN